MSKGWVTVAEAATLAGVPKRTLSRRLNALNSAADGKLVRWVGHAGERGKRMVNTAVLREMLTPRTDEADSLLALNFRVAELESNARNVKLIQRRHGKAISKLNSIVSSLEHNQNWAKLGQTGPKTPP